MNTASPKGIAAARVALQTYTQVIEGVAAEEYAADVMPSSAQTALTDLLADLRHVADEMEIDFDAADTTAVARYGEECDA